MIELPDLKYDTEAMRKSASDYRDAAKKLRKVKKDLKQHITDLKETHWKSDAGKAFLEVYEDTWADNAEKYAAVMVEMAGQLEKAARDYDLVTDKIKKIGK